MRIFARRIEAPTVQNRYATKWQIAVERVGRLEFYDRVSIDGPVCFYIEEDKQPAVFAQVLAEVARVEGMRNVDGVEQWTRLQ